MMSKKPGESQKMYSSKFTLKSHQTALHSSTSPTKVKTALARDPITKKNWTALSKLAKHDSFVISAVTFPNSKKPSMSKALSITHLPRPKSSASKAAKLAESAHEEGGKRELAVSVCLRILKYQGRKRNQYRKAGTRKQRV